MSPHTARSAIVATLEDEWLTGNSPDISRLECTPIGRLNCIDLAVVYNRVRGRMSLFIGVMILISIDPILENTLSPFPHS